MFKPRVPKAAMLYNIDTPLVAGTAVRQKTNGFLEVAPSGINALGFLAADVRDWNSRTEAEILFPEHYHGHMLACEWINKPGVNAPTKIGVRIGKDFEYEVMINDALVPGDELVADANGQLVKKPNGDPRTSLAVVKEAGMGVGLNLDYQKDPTQRVYVVRTLI